MSGLTNQDRTFLRKFLRERFNLDELKDLAFDIGVDYEDFPHETKPDFVRGLIDYLENRQNMRSLVKYVIEQRPDDQLVQILARLPAQSGLEKVQLILSNAKIKSKPDLKKKLAALLDIPIDQVNLIATAVGSVKVLVSVPPAAAEKLDQLPLPYQLEDYEIVEIKRFHLLPKVRRDGWRKIYSAKSAVKWIGIGSAVTTGLTLSQIAAWIGGGILALLLLSAGGVAIWYQGRPDMTVVNRCEATLPIDLPEFAYDLLGLPTEFAHGESINFPVLSGPGMYELAVDGRPPEVVLRLPQPLPIVGISEIPLGPEDEDEEFYIDGERVEFPSQFTLSRNQQIELSLCGR